MHVRLWLVLAGGPARLTRLHKFYNQPEGSKQPAQRGLRTHLKKALDDSNAWGL